MPCAAAGSLPGLQRRDPTDHADQGDWIEYGHTMESYIGGQLECGFVLTGYKEYQMDDITELYFATRAVK